MSMYRRLVLGLMLFVATARPVPSMAQAILDGIPPATTAERDQVARLCGALRPGHNPSQMLGCTRFQPGQDPRRTALLIANGCSNALQLTGRPDTRAAGMRQDNQEAGAARKPWTTAEIAAVQSDADAYRAIIDTLDCRARYGTTANSGRAQASARPVPSPSNICDGDVIDWHVRSGGNRTALMVTMRNGSWNTVFDLPASEAGRFPWQVWIAQNCPVYRAPPTSIADDIDAWLRRFFSAPLTARCQPQGELSHSCETIFAPDPNGPKPAGMGVRG